jgi:hypothetical protein
LYTRLGEGLLTSGEWMEVGVVRGPDSEWLPRVAPFLGHKNADTRVHIQRSLEGPLDDLQTRYYVGCVDGRIISQVMIVGDRGVGILGHVYTLPEERKKGAYAAVMRHQMADCVREGFRALCLGTGFETPPYWIYHSFGFRSVAPDSGRMKWLASPDAERDLFRPAPVTLRNLQWDDWGWLELHAFQPVRGDEELPRCPTLNEKGQGNVEGPFVTFQLRREREPIQTQVLVSETGATVGWAFLSRDARWFGDAWLLNVYAHPNFTEHMPALLAALELPDEPVAAYATLPDGPRAAALAAAGLQRATVLPRWLRHGSERRDLGVWIKA